MHFKILLIISLHIFFVASVLSQRRITTLSGQKIILLQNGKWIKDELNIDTIDQVPMVDSNHIASLNTENKEMAGIKLLLEAAKLKEIENVVLMDDLDKEVAIKEVQLSQARQMNDKQKEAAIKMEASEFKLKLKTVEKIYKSTSELVFAARSIDNLPTERKIKKMRELGLALSVDITPYIPVSSVRDTQILPAENTPKNAHYIVQNTPTIKKNKKIDNCNIIRNERINKQIVLETKPEFLFSFTPEKLKNYFKEKELLYADASVLRIGKNKFLRITIKLFSKDAAKNYGLIHKSSLLKILFISGKSLALRSTEESDGSLENYTGKVVYIIDYPITGDDSDMIYEVPIDNVGIMWSSGFEVYDVYNVDVIMRQLKCLQSTAIH